MAEPTWDSDPNLPVAEALSKAARSWHSQSELEQVVESIVLAAVNTVPGAEEASVSLLRGGALHNLAASNDLGVRVNALEHQLGQGPCVSAVAEHDVYRTGDLANEPRWPKFGPAAAQLGVTSMLGYRLYTDRSTLGSLDIYSGRPEAFDEQAERIGELFAAHAAVAVAALQHRSQMQHALTSRDVIGTAKGILMARERVTEQQAFAMLSEASQQTNIKLRDLAAWLVNDANGKAEPDS
jgi:transcriptional regulator with GAF, ATPase, and Fis domain